MGLRKRIWRLGVGLISWVFEEERQGLVSLEGLFGAWMIPVRFVIS